MDDLQERQWAARQAAEESLAAADDALAELAARRQERLQRGETDWQAPDPAPSPPRPQRPPERPAQAQAPARDWQAEQRWIEGIIDRRSRGFADGVGEAIAIIRTQIRAEFEAKIAELRAEIAAKEAGALQEILRGLAQLDQRLGQFAEGQAGFAPVDGTTDTTQKQKTH